MPGTDVRPRRAVAALLIASGVLLCGLSARHYIRGWRAQEEGRRVLEARMSGQGVSAQAETRENPGVGVPVVLTAVPGAFPAETPQALPAENDAPRTGLPPGYPYGEPIARLKIPIARIDAIVFGGADAATLEKGPGHVPGTELPGESTPRHNCVITGHRDSHFRNLGWLRPGHEIELDSPAGDRRYRVVSREIVTPDAVRVLRPSVTERLTLITCYPFNYVGPAPKRLVVVAEPEPARPDP